MRKLVLVLAAAAVLLSCKSKPPRTETLAGASLQVPADAETDARAAKRTLDDLHVAALSMNGGESAGFIDRRGGLLIGLAHFHTNIRPNVEPLKEGPLSVPGVGDMGAKVVKSSVTQGEHFTDVRFDTEFADVVNRERQLIGKTSGGGYDLWAASCGSKSSDPGQCEKVLASLKVDDEGQLSPP